MVLLGNPSVGKTAIRERYLGLGFIGKYNMTIGADFALKRVAVNETLYVMQIWDLAGQSGFTSTRSLYYRGAMAALLVFDISRPETFHKLNNWIHEILDNRGEYIPIILVGNKSDLRETSTNTVSKRQARRYARKITEETGFETPYIETSALTGEGVDEAFLTMIQNVSEVIKEEER